MNPPLDAFLTYRLHQLHKLSDARSAEAYLRETGLPLGEGRCLAAVGAFGPLSVVHLAQRANLDKGQASRAAQALVARGLVLKQPDPVDARAVLLRLSARGRRVHRRVMRLIARRNDEIFGVLDAAEQHQLAALFERLIAHAQGPSPAG